jgi:predicted nucleotidyltransferase
MIAGAREQQILESIRAVFAKERATLAGRRVVLFGSRASGRARTRSDFDIGIDGKDPLDAVSFARITERIDDINTLYRIDLVDIQATTERFRANALSTFEVIYE